MYVASPLGCLGGFNIPYYTKEKILTKEHIFSQFIGDTELKMYIPDNMKLSAITRELLLAILFYIKREKYLSLYSLYKKTKLQRATTGNKIFDIKIDPSHIDKLNNYVSVEM